MMENFVGPSELHLKKELTALRKARFLRDPETCSSWKSPLSSKSFAVASALNNQNGTTGNSASVNGANVYSEISKNEKRQKKVYLYNWRHHSCKSSDSGLQLDEDCWKLSVEGSPEDSLINHHKFDAKSDTNHEVPVTIHSVRRASLTTPVTRISRKSKRPAALKHQFMKHSEVSKLLDLPSRSLRDFDSFEQSDDTEYCNSENPTHLTQLVVPNNGYFSHSASPLFSGSGCGNWSYSSKILRNARREGSSHSYTPASTGSYYRYGDRNASSVGSWDGSAVSGNDLDQLDSRRGCGVPCYWSKRTRGRECGDSYSPSLSDILRRTGSSIFCGGQTLYQKKRSASSRNRTCLRKSLQGLPLLTNSSDGGRPSVDSASDDLSTNIGELELEALSRLDGKRWSSCKSQEGLELIQSEQVDLEMPDQRSLSQKYKPRSFDDIVGQSIVVHSLSNALLRGRIAPAYLFHGPHGTGKTSAARIYASALICLSTDEKRPCGHCRECSQFPIGNTSRIQEVDAADKKGLDSVRYLLKNISVSTTISRYKVFVIDQCHMLSSRMWSTFMKFLEEPPPRVVFIFITIDADNLSRAIVSRCQKYLFSKVKDVDIVNRLRKLSLEENLDVDLDALNLIALNSDGSLRDAETMLDQLSLMGKRVTTTLVNDLVGVVSDEKLLDLLEIAMSSDTAETVKRSRELMDSGVDQMALMSQLAGLIMDIIAGTYCSTSSQCSGAPLGCRSLTEAELERLQEALKILSDAEKQIRFSSERSTWFTAALLQLCSGHSTESTESSSSSKQTAKKTKMGKFNRAKGPSCENKYHPLLTFRESSLALVPRVPTRNFNSQCLEASNIRNETVTSVLFPAHNQSVVRSLQNGTHTDGATSKKFVQGVSSENLAEIWIKCIEGCHSKTLRQLLSAHGRLLSISEAEGVLNVFVVFEDEEMKIRAERYLSSIRNSIEIALKHNVEVRIGLVPENRTNRLNSVPQSPASIHREIVGYLNKERKLDFSSIYMSSEREKQKGGSDLPRRSLDNVEATQHGTLGKCESSPLEGRGFQLGSMTKILSERDVGDHSILEEGKEILAQKVHSVASDEQRLESAWVQAAGKNSSGAVSHARCEKSQVLPQNGASHQNQNEPLMDVATKQWEDELSHELRALKLSYYKKQNGGQADHYAISPSLLHSNNFTANPDKENPGYESGSGCNALFCWSSRRPPRGKPGSHVKPQKTGHLNLFGQCGKMKAEEKD